VSAVAAVVVAGALAVAGAAVWRGNAPQPAATPSAAAPHRPASHRPATPRPSSPAATPSRTGPAANTASYDLEALPDVDVYAVNPRLPVDPDPGGQMTPLLARAASAQIPVFADPVHDPAAGPVARLAQTPIESSGVFPVVAQYTDWVEVLLVGRQGVPPTGDARQTIGWLRRADVRLESNDTHIVVDLAQHSIDIVSGATTTHVTSDFAWGTPSTPTPIGRTFVMEVAVNPALSYTRGHPILYLATQSGALAGFDGGSVAVTAIHYYDAHEGPISNGCIRVDATAIETLDKVPPGTVVYIKN
jgi:hypothetical protein